MQGLGQARGTAPVTDDDEPRLCGLRHRGVRRVQHQPDVSLVAVTRQAKQHPVAKLGRAQRVRQRPGERVPWRREDVPVAWRRRHGAGSPYLLDKLDGEGTHPGPDALGQPGLGIAGQLGAGEVVEHLGQVRQGGCREARGRHRRRHAELARRLIDDLPDRDRAEVQVVKRSAIGPHGLDRQLGPLGHEPSQQVDAGLRLTARRLAVRRAVRRAVGSLAVCRAVDSLAGRVLAGLVVASTVAGRRKLARAGEEPEFLVKRQRPGEPVAEQHVVPHRRAQRVRRRDRGEQARERRAVRIERDARGARRDVSSQARQHPPGPDLEQQVDVGCHQVHGLVEVDRLEHLPDEQVAQVSVGQQGVTGDRGQHPARERLERHVSQVGAEPFGRGRHRRGMERVRHVDPGRGHALAACRSAYPVDGIGRAGNDRLVRAVVARDDNGLAAQHRLDICRTRRHAGHGTVASTGVRHHPAARRREVKQRGLAHPARPVQAGQLAEAVAGRGSGLDPQQCEHSQAGYR